MSSDKRLVASTIQRYSNLYLTRREVGATEPEFGTIMERKRIQRGECVVYIDSGLGTETPSCSTSTGRRSFLECSQKIQQSFRSLWMYIHCSRQ